jgi:tryptophan-rich sensory protein
MTANTIWTPVFFGAFDLRGSLFIIAILWLSITAYIPIALKANKLAGYLFTPYWLWVSFAAYLNFAYLKLNAVS